jgi:RND superfamily putative drug exporter
MFDRLGRLATNYPGKVCTAWLLLAAGLTWFAPAWQCKAQDDDIRFLPPNTPSVRAFRLLEQAFPQDVFASRAIFTLERTDEPLSGDDLALVDDIVTCLEGLKRDEPGLKIGAIASHRDPVIGKRLISADKQCTLIHMSLVTPYLALQTREAVDKAEAKARVIVARAGYDAPRLYVTGPAGVGRDLVKAGAESLDQTTIATVALVVVVLLLVYRSPLLAMVPLATIGVSMWVALKLLALVSLIPGVQLVNVSQVFAIVILFGAGTDYCLFLISRYREKLLSGKPPAESVRRSVRSVGGAVAASAGTVICGLGLMAFADFAKVRSAGPVIALALAVGLAASLTLTPALLKLLGLKVFWPDKVKPRLPGVRRAVGAWDRISRFVVRRPALVWGVSAAILAPFAVLGLMTTPTFSPVGDLAPTSGCIRGLAAIQRHFTAGETGPLTVLLASHGEWSGPSGREVIDRLSRGFAQLENVAEVRSLTQPLGEPLPTMSVTSLLGRPENGVSSFFSQPRAGAATAQQNELTPFLRGLLKVVDPIALARQHYVASCPENGAPRFVTRLDVVLKSDPFAPESAATLETIETWLADFLPAQSGRMAPVRAECYGVPVHTRDMGAVIERDRARVNGLVLGGVLLILLVLVRQLWLAGYLLATVLLSYYATLGLTTLFAAAWAGKPIGQVEWRVPFFLFTILVAVGEDYNILMVSRAIAERRRRGADRGIRRGLARTGGTITACGVIMAGTFATLMLAGLGTLVQIGFALAVGVLLDTFLVRPFLVPSFLLIVWRGEEAADRQRLRRYPRAFRQAG